MSVEGDIEMLDGAPAPLPESTFAPTSAKVGRRRRRPSGAAPPLPRKIGASGWTRLALLAVVIVWMTITIHNRHSRRLTDRFDTAIARELARARTGWLTTVALNVDKITRGWFVGGFALATAVALIMLRRWRHLFALLGGIVLFEVVGTILYQLMARPRPFGVRIIGHWEGYSLPSPPVAVLTAFLVGAVYTLVPAGRQRGIAKIVAYVVVTIVSLCRLYLGIDHLTDVVLGQTLAAGILVAVFRLFTPNDVFPVRYRTGKTAHLDVGGRRGEAIRAAITDQLGLTVVDVKPVGLEGSGGSTPLRITVAGDPDTHLFGKLYAMSHVRADRWYKFGRTILYGRLEDEAPFQSVRRFVEYEDYTIRLLADAGIPTAKALGIIEITPEREYMLVTEFIDGSKEIGVADIDDDVIDEAMMIVRRLWHAGLAHRDVKPANLLVRDGHVYLIDAFFVQVRPSPWRQAIDLANMMLVLAVRTDPDRVYQRALRLFTPDEIAEAFAATRGVASPTQLRAMMKRDGRDLLAAFRALAPERRPIAIQRWSLRRVLMAAAAALVTLLFVTIVRQTLEPAGEIELPQAPNCGTSSVVVLMAQSVPSATLVPCVSSLPAGWKVGGVRARSNVARVWLDSDIAGMRAVEARLLPPAQCSVDGATAVPSDEAATRRFERIDRLPPALRATRTYLFDGGCVTYQFDFAASTPPSAVFAVDQALSFVSRSALVEHVDRVGRAKLCGAGVECPG